MKSFMRYIMRIARQNAQYRCEMSKNTDFSGYECQYIMCVCHHPGMTQEQISTHLCIDKSNVTRRLATLEENGYITKKAMESDKRNLEVFPTEKAIKMLPYVRQINQNWEEYITADLSEEEKTILNIAIEKIRLRANEWEKVEFQPIPMVAVEEEGNNIEADF
ncbi:MAG: MarR family transcriptional regulator [Oscillospiraceae bacterium]